MRHTIRPGTPADAPSVAEVRVASWRAAYRGLIPAAVLDGLDPAEHEGFERMLSDPSKQAWVAEVGERLVGYAFLTPSRDEDADASWGEIPMFYLHPDVWRSGIGRSLMTAVLEAASARRLRTLKLWVMKENVAAQGFYEAMGFRPDGATKVDTRLVDAPLNENRYERSL